MLIVVCGLSKSGKSSLIKAAVAEGLDVPIVKASQLLGSSGRPTQALTASDALGNQPELMQLLVEYVRGNKSTVLDGHLLIETLDGPQLVPEAYLTAVGLVGIVAVTAPPQTIASRRLETAFTTDPQEIGELGLIENIQARRMARIANIPFFEVGHLDVRAFTKAVSECLKKADAASH
jgi:adenylate kinase